MMLNKAEIIQGAGANQRVLGKPGMFLEDRMTLPFTSFLL